MRIYSARRHVKGIILSRWRDSLGTMLMFLLTLISMYLIIAWRG